VINLSTHAAASSWVVPGKTPCAMYQWSWSSGATSGLWQVTPIFCLKGAQTQSTALEKSTAERDSAKAGAPAVQVPRFEYGGGTRRDDLVDLGSARSCDDPSRAVGRQLKVLVKKDNTRESRGTERC